MRFLLSGFVKAAAAFVGIVAIVWLARDIDWAVAIPLVVIGCVISILTWDQAYPKGVMAGRERLTFEVRTGLATLEAPKRNSAAKEAKTERTFDDEERRQALGHITYEANMCGHSVYRIVADRATLDGVQRNAYLESALLHSRSLYEFLATRSSRDDDMRLIDF